MTPRYFHASGRSVFRLCSRGRFGVLPPPKKIDDWAFEPDSVESVPTHKQPLQARPPAEGPLAALSQMDHPDAREGPLVHGHVVTEWSARCRERGRFSRWRLRSRLSGAIRNVLRGI